MYTVLFSVAVLRSGLGLETVKEQSQPCLGLRKLEIVLETSQVQCLCLRSLETELIIDNKTEQNQKKTVFSLHV